MGPFRLCHVPLDLPEFCGWRHHVTSVMGGQYHGEVCLLMNPGPRVPFLNQWLA